MAVFSMGNGEKAVMDIVRILWTTSFTFLSRGRLLMNKCVISQVAFFVLRQSVFSA